MKLWWRYSRGSTFRCVQLRPAELFWGGQGLCKESLGRDAGGVSQRQPEQSPRHVCFHQQSFVVCLRRKSIPEGEGDKSFIAQRLAVNPVPIIFFLTTLKKLPRTSSPGNTEPHLHTSKGLGKNLQLPFVLSGVVISGELKMFSIPLCLSYIGIRNVFVFFFSICSLALMHFREFIRLKSLYLRVFGSLCFTVVSSDLLPIHSVHLPLFSLHSETHTLFFCLDSWKWAKAWKTILSNQLTC